MTEIDEHWAKVCSGDRRALGNWMGRVERPIRRALQPFARAIDAETVVQETLLRMWQFAQERETELTGDDASLRYAIRMSRNLARNMARKWGRMTFLPPEDLPEPGVEPEPPPDPFLRRAIRECFDRLAKKPLLVLQARLAGGHHSADEALAAGIGMKMNTFIKNIVRARQQLAQCLRAKGVDLEGISP
jgi:DNA-directed RNA polymerase specialized sigma24 family protein